MQVAQHSFQKEEPKTNQPLTEVWQKQGLRAKLNICASNPCFRQPEKRQAVKKLN
jgi:hypothetical protein